MRLADLAVAVIGGVVSGAVGGWISAGVRMRNNGGAMANEGSTAITSTSNSGNIAGRDVHAVSVDTMRPAQVVCTERGGDLILCNVGDRVAESFRWEAEGTIYLESGNRSTLPPTASLTFSLVADAATLRWYWTDALEGEMSDHYRSGS